MVLRRRRETIEKLPYLLMLITMYPGGWEDIMRQTKNFIDKGSEGLIKKVKGSMVH